MQYISLKLRSVLDKAAFVGKFRIFIRQLYEEQC